MKPDPGGTWGQQPLAPTTTHEGLPYMHCSGMVRTRVAAVPGQPCQGACAIKTTQWWAVRIMPTVQDGMSTGITAHVYAPCMATDPDMLRLSIACVTRA